VISTSSQAEVATGAFFLQPPEEMKLLFLDEIDAQNFIFPVKIVYRIILLTIPQISAGSRA
jgi:hypothetical protein